MKTEDFENFKTRKYLDYRSELLHLGKIDEAMSEKEYRYKYKEYLKEQYGNK